MDEGRDWRWAFHGVGKPDVERNLGRLPRGANHQQETDGGQQSGAGFFYSHASNGLKYVAEVQRAEVLDHQEERDEKAEVADAVDDECFLAGGCGGVFGEPEAYEHEEHEEVEIREETIEAALFPHIADRVDMNEESDAGDHQQHD